MESASKLSAFAQYGVGDATKTWVGSFTLYLEANQNVTEENLRVSTILVLHFESG